MKLQQLLLQQLGAVHNKKDWFVSVNDAIYGLTEEQAEAKTSGAEHSVKELVIHILFWCEWYLTRYRGTAVFPEDETNEYTFTVQCLGVEHISWETLKERLDKVLSEWHNEIESMTDEQLLSKISGTEELWLTKISNIILHVAYHTGEIVYLRKMLGNWDSSHGVS